MALFVFGVPKLELFPSMGFNGVTTVLEIREMSGKMKKGRSGQGKVRGFVKKRGDPGKFDSLS